MAPAPAERIRGRRPSGSSSGEIWHLSSWEGGREGGKVDGDGVECVCVCEVGVEGG